MAAFVFYKDTKEIYRLEGELPPSDKYEIIELDVDDVNDLIYDEQQRQIRLKTQEEKLAVWKECKRKEIAQARYEAETGGLTLEDGTIIATDRESQSLLMGAALFAKEDPNYTVNWKGQNGWVVLDASTILDLAAAVRQHVQSCFDKEKQLNEQIDTATTIDEVKNISW